MIYELKYEERAARQIRKLDPATRKLIKSWIEKNFSIQMTPDSMEKVCREL